MRRCRHHDGTTTGGRGPLPTTPPRCRQRRRERNEPGVEGETVIVTGADHVEITEKPDFAGGAYYPAVVIRSNSAIPARTETPNGDSAKERLRNGPLGILAHRLTGFDGRK